MGKIVNILTRALLLLAVLPQVGVAKEVQYSLKVAEKTIQPTGKKVIGHCSEW